MTSLPSAATLREAAKLAERIEELQKELAVLIGSEARVQPADGRRKGKRGRRKMSEAAREKIAEAQRRRWAKAKRASSSGEQSA